MIDLLIGLFGLSALVFALLVVTLRQPMRAALALIAHMISLAAIFACLGVHVVALFQVLIYVGAVMVFMIYTIMLLDDRDSSYVHLFSRWSLPALVVIASVILALASLLIAPAPQTVAAAASGPFGFLAFSVAFMTRYWFHFEVATVLLLIAIVAAWTVISQRG
jgi:NADH-quinone oxidoreductase subunit J